MKIALALVLFTVGCGGPEVPACGSACDSAAKDAMVTAACCDGKCCAETVGCDSGERYVQNDGTLGACVAGALDLAPGDVMLAIASPAFDASVMETWAPLLRGAAIFVPARGWDAHDLARCIAEHGVTHLVLTTPVFHQLVHEVPAALDRVRQVVVGGDVISPAAWRSAVATCCGGTTSTARSTK